MHLVIARHWGVERDMHFPGACPPQFVLHGSFSLRSAHIGPIYPGVSQSY